MPDSRRDLARAGRARGMDLTRQGRPAARPAERLKEKGSLREYKVYD